MKDEADGPLSLRERVRVRGKCYSSTTPQARKNEAQARIKDEADGPLSLRERVRVRVKCYSSTTLQARKKEA
jgi:hypothetical protein